MNPPYEFCAHKFLDLWRTEEPLHKAMSGTPSARQVRDALKHFRVARTFKGLSDEVAEKISQDLVEVSDSEGIYSDKVTSLARRFKKNFGQLNLSAASKLLWLRKRRPYLIYDDGSSKGFLTSISGKWVRRTRPVLSRPSRSQPTFRTAD